MTISEPALCAELKIRADPNVALVNSREVAEVFGKRHDNVLRDISALGISSDLRGAWFRAIDYIDAKGEASRSFDPTTEGFTLLVMGWTGERMGPMGQRAMSLSLWAPTKNRPSRRSPQSVAIHSVMAAAA